jgi:hypothetical protein
MVLDYHPFVWPPWNAAENSQRQAQKLSLTLSESTTRDGLRLASRTPQTVLALRIVSGLRPEVTGSAVGFVPTNAPAVTDQSVARSRLLITNPRLCTSHCD